MACTRSCNLHNAQEEENAFSLMPAETDAGR